MVQKRPFDDEETHEVSCKVPRQVENCDKMALFSEYDNSEGAPRIPDNTGVGDYTKREGADNPELDKINKNTPPVNTEDLDDPLPCNRSITSIGNSSTSEEDILSEAPFPASFFPEYFFPEHRAVARYEEIYSILLEHAPQKAVPIGPDHQADIPEWSPQEVSAYLNETSSRRVDEDVNKFAGTCVIPMSDFEASEECCDKFGNGRCICQHKGSIVCVRLHAWEARDRLVRTIGLDKFIDLGFFDMGEQVAERWTKDEEKLFHEIVFSNPSSIGRNFWIALSFAFPSRTKREIVSYYFNVFMLRKRAEQNRCDPMHVDSDNDEWQASEEEDSAVESPVCDDIHSDSHLEDDINEYEDDVGGEVCDDHENVSPGSNMYDMSALCDNKLVDNPVRHYNFENVNKTWDDRGYLGTQDDSCTSSDTGTAVSLNHFKNGSGNSRGTGFNSMENGTGHDFIIDTCKPWDSGYVASQKKEDFLPTCMIEEVFRDGSLSCKTDGKSS